MESKGGLFGSGERDTDMLMVFSDVATEMVGRKCHFCFGKLSSSPFMQSMRDCEHSWWPHHPHPPRAPLANLKNYRESVLDIGAGCLWFRDVLLSHR